MTPEIISLLVQVPLVGAFIVFTVVLLRSFNTSQKELQQQTQLHEQSLQAETLKHLDDQAHRWQEIIGIERERRKEAMDQGLREVETLVASIDQLSACIDKQTEQIARHDAAAISRHSEVIRQLDQR